MTREEAKEVFINRGYVNVKGGTIFDGDKWRQSVQVITEWLKEQPCEDAISKEQLLKYLKDNSEDFPDYHEAIEYVLSMPSVTPQPCEGAIRRTAVLNTLDTMDKALDKNRTVEEYKELLRECYEQLLPVSVAERTGHWKECEDNTSFVRQIPRRWLECSNCGWSCDLGYKSRYKYCPNCGARMAESEEKK